MKDVLVIVCYTKSTVDKPEEMIGVSSEAYSTMDKARDFLRDKRRATQMANAHNHYETKDYIYVIKTLEVK